MKTIVYILIGISLIGAVIRRWFFNPALTEQAVDAYTAWLPKNLSSSQLMTPRWESFEFSGRTLRAHEDVHKVENLPRLALVEIDVHPSMTPILTISASNFIILKEGPSFEKLKSVLLGSPEKMLATTQEEILELTNEQRSAIRELTGGESAG